MPFTSTDDMPPTAVTAPEAEPRLDPLETPVTSLPAASVSHYVPLDLTPDTPFVHRGWHEQRARTYAAMLHCATSPSALSRFRTCRSEVWLLCSHERPGVYRFAAACCHSKWCVPCARTRAYRLAANLNAALDTLRCRFLTLTLRSTDQPLTVLLDFLLKSFRTLRATPLWKERVAGGAAFIEITRGKNLDHWHVHLHALLVGKFLDKAALKAEWLRITGDSYIVKIRRPTTHEEVTRYVTKYVTKPLDHSAALVPVNLAEAITALRGRRTVITFGTWKNLHLTRPTEPSEWYPVRPASNYEYGCNGDHVLSEHVVFYLHYWRQGVYAFEFNVNEQPRPPPMPEHSHDRPT